MRKESLTEEEARISRNITNILNELPDYFKDYIGFLEDHYVSFSTQLIEARNLRLATKCFREMKGYSRLKDVPIEDFGMLTEDYVVCYTQHPLEKKRIRDKAGLPSDKVQLQRWRSIEKFNKYVSEKGL